jgi:putative heme-binding domain-containing protein
LPAELRVAAAEAFLVHAKTLDEALFELLAEQCDPSVDSVLRLRAARSLGAAELSPIQRRRVIALITQAAALELQSLVAPFEQGGSGQEGVELVAALSKSPGAESLPPARLRRIISHYPESVASAAEKLMERLNAGARDEALRLAELQSQMGDGDPERGKRVFFGKRASCFACHRVKDSGGNVGPNLSQLGAIRTERDFLESIVLPSASFARGYEPISVVTLSGKIHSGIIGRQSAEAIYLRGSDRSEVRILRSEIEEMHPARVSVMPKGLDRILRPEELGDLVAYLRSLK